MSVEEKEKIKEIEERVKKLEEKIDDLIGMIESGVIIDQESLAKSFHNLSEIFGIIIKEFAKEFADRIAYTIATIEVVRFGLADQIMKEGEEIRKYAVERGLSLPEAYQEMKDKGILPPGFEMFEKTKNSFKEMLK